MATLPGNSRAPRNFILQWHVTERCNLRCAHCYQEGYSCEELSFPELQDVVDQLMELLAWRRSRESESPPRGIVNVSGGEPFVRGDFLELLAVLGAHRPEIQYGILTNGTLIDRSVARRLRDLRPAYVQVSIEGAPKTNDRVRGAGSHARTVKALENLARESIPSVISFTAHRQNYREFPEVARLGKAVGARWVWADRLIPWGSATATGCEPLSPLETREFFELMADARRDIEKTFGRTEVRVGRALQFLVGGGVPYRCRAGEDLLTLQPDGEVYPCRRLPIGVGNIRDSRLLDIYRESDLLRRLRAHRVSEGCESCAFAGQCRGGLRCLAYAATGDPFRADPGCWRATSGAPTTGTGRESGGRSPARGGLHV